MKLYKYFLFPILIAACFFNNSVFAQSLNGKKIYLSTTDEITLKFHSSVAEFYLTNKESAGWIKIKSATLTTTITISTDKENFVSSSLVIKEGKNMHRFNLVYKEKLEDEELLYDFSDLKKLVLMSKELENSQKNDTLTRAANNNPLPKDQNSTIADNTQSNGNSETQSKPAEDYFDLLTKANNAYGIKKYSDAKDLYVRASLLKPSETWPKDQIARIEKKIEDAGNEIENTKKDTQYKGFIDLAEKALSEKAFDEAKNYCSQALTIKPNDAYVQYKLKEIDKKLADDLAQKQANQIEAAYKSFMDIGNDNFKKGLYDDAKSAYNQALLVKPKDFSADYQLKEIDKKLEEKKKQNEIKKLDDAYGSFMSLGNKNLEAGLLDEASSAYNQALIVKPDDFSAKAKLKEIEKKIATNKQLENEKLEELYKSFISSGNEALNNQMYEDARNAFKQALSAKPNDIIAQAKLNDIDRQITDHAKQEEIQNREDVYKSYMARGKDAIGKELYDDAKDAFNNALTIKPNDTEANKQLDKIKTIVNDLLNKEKQEQRKKELDDKYIAAINLADTAFSAGIYDVAKDQYKSALQIKAEEAYPLNKLKQIENILTSISVEKNKHKQDSLNNLKYNDAIENADKALKNNDYKNAITSYQLALKLKPAEPYPQEKISEINITLKDIQDAKKAEEEKIALHAKTDKQYNFAIANGNEALQNDNFEVAKNSFDAAAKLKPDEDLPHEKLLFISNKLEEIAKKAEIEDKFQQANAMGDSLAFIKNDYIEALKWYRQASNLKPTDEYSKKQIIYLQGVLTKKDSVEIVQKNEAERISNFNDGMDAYKRGNQARTELRYEDALKEYRFFLTKIDTSDFNGYQYGQKQFIISAKDYIVRIEEYLAHSKPQLSKKDSLVSNTVLSGKNASSTNNTDSGISVFYYPVSKEIDLNYLGQKYPGIEFTQPPPEQKFSNPVFNYDEQTSIIRRTIIDDKPHLNMGDSVSGNRLTIQNISFKKNKVYFKFLIQNSDTTDFCTGAMNLNIIKNNNSSISLPPGYISDFPILMSGKEKVFVYVINDITIAEDENLKFQMTDRLNKLQLKIIIPGTVYNREKK